MLVKMLKNIVNYLEKEKTRKIKFTHEFIVPERTEEELKKKIDSVKSELNAWSNQPTPRKYVGQKEFLNIPFDPVSNSGDSVAKVVSNEGDSVAKVIYTPAQQDIIDMLEGEGKFLIYREIAEKLGITTSTLYGHLKRIKDRHPGEYKKLVGSRPKSPRGAGSPYYNRTTYGGKKISKPVSSGSNPRRSVLHAESCPVARCTYETDKLYKPASISKMWKHCREKHYKHYGLPLSMSGKNLVEGKDYITYYNFKKMIERGDFDQMAVQLNPDVTKLLPGIISKNYQDNVYMKYGTKLSFSMTKVPLASSLHVPNNEFPIKKVGKRDRKWWAPKKIAKYLNVNQTTVTKYCSIGLMRSIKLGSLWYIDSIWLREHFEESKNSSGHNRNLKVINV